MKKILFTNLLFLLMSVCLFAQPQEEVQHTRSCGHTQALEVFYKDNPNAKKQAEKVKADFAVRLKQKHTSGKSTFKSAPPTKRIPVVFHVIYGACDDGNIERSRIDDAVEQLNNDFQGLNGQDPNLPFKDRVGSMDVEFFLAEKDLNGNPTIGITRTESDLTYAGVGFGPKLRELIMWPRNTYLNVYVVNQINSYGSSGVAVYPEDAEDRPDLDGIAMADWAIGPLPGEEREYYNTIISHEVGHWLGLGHIWGNSNDVESASSCGIDDFDHLDEALKQYVVDADNPSATYPESRYNDTPNTIGNSTFRTGDFCPEVSGVDKCNGEDIDMLENIMDYTRCAVMFTKGQVNYMHEALSDGIAERNQIPLNAASVTLGNTSRVVFQEATLKESEPNNGTVNHTLDIELVNASFSASTPSNLVQGEHYNITWPTGFNIGSLQVNVMKSSASTATLQVTGSTSTHSEDIDLTIVFQSSAFNTGITAANRTKVLNLDFIDGPIRKSASKDLYVGPESRWYAGKSFTSGLQIGFGYYSDTDRYFVYAEHPVEVGVLQDNSVQILSKGNTIPSASDFTSASSPHLTLDVSSIASGAEFYVSFRTGCSPNYNYGWVRVQKGTTCDEIKVLDTFYNTTPGQSITAELNTPHATYSAFSMSELVSGGVSTVEIELEGNIPSGKGFKNSISSNDFNVVEVDSGKLPPELPTGFTASNLSVSVINPTKAVLSLATPPDELQDFQFKLIFNSSAFIAGTPIIDMGEPPIKVFYTHIVNESIGKTLVHQPIDYRGFRMPRSNGVDYSLGIQAVSEGYLFYSVDPFIPQIACKTTNSDEIRLFDCGDNTDNLNFKPMGGGLSGSSTSLDGQVYINMNDLLNWTNDSAYVVIKYDLRCGQSLTAWVELGVSEPNVKITLKDVALNEDPTEVIDVCDKGPCDPILLSGEDVRRLYVENAIVGGVQNPSTHSNNAYQDHTNIVLPLQVGDNYVNFIQGNGVSDSGSEYDLERAHWYAFIDFNENDYFEGDELVLSYQGEHAQGYLNYIAPGTPLGTYKMRVVVSFYDLAKYSTDFSCSPNNLTYGETEDYTVSLSNSLNCTDTDNDGVCALNDCDDNNVNMPTTPGTPCNDGNSGSDNDVIQEDGCTCKGVITPDATYCTPNIPTNSNDVYIYRVRLEELEHDSGNEGYGDFTTVDPAYLSQSEEYSLHAYKPSDDNSAFFWRVWIDYNQDGDLNDPGELVIHKDNHSERYIIESFTVPADALDGPTLMRVHLREYTTPDPDPCGNNDDVNSEIEDYTVIIDSLISCTDTDDDGVCADVDCDDNDATIPTAPGAPCNDGNPGSDNDVIQEDGCTCKGVITPDATYCTPNIPTNSNDVYIYRVRLEQLEHDSDNEGYGDFTTAAPAYLSQTEEYSLHAYKPSDDNSAFFWRVWIDYNQDGDLNDPGELVIHKDNYSERYIIERFTVPVGAFDGPTLMRIYLREYITPDPDPCGNNNSVDSEIEDYTVIIGSDECEPFYDISGTINPGVFKAEDYIESDGQVLTGNTVTFQAGNLVHLLPGFTARAGTSSMFHALIDDCTPTAPKEEITENEPAIRNYPNPFNGQTTIEFTLPEDSAVTLFVSDAMGKRVAVLMDNETSIAGTHQIIFDGNRYAAGMYYYTLQAGEYTATQKMVLIK